MRAFTIEPRYGLRALTSLQDFVFFGRALPNPLPGFILEAYESEEGFRRKAMEAMRAAGLGKDYSGSGCRLQKFMNRLFGLPIQLQTHVFDLFLYLVRACYSISPLAGVNAPSYNDILRCDGSAQRQNRSCKGGEQVFRGGLPTPYRVPT